MRLKVGVNLFYTRIHPYPFQAKFSGFLVGVRKAVSMYNRPCTLKYPLVAHYLARLLLLLTLSAVTDINHVCTCYREFVARVSYSIGLTCY